MVHRATPPTMTDDEEETALRIAVDVSGWIYKACQMNGDMLADEKHLSNYGRATLFYQQQQQQQAAEAEAAAAGGSTAATTDAAAAAAPSTISQNKQATDIQEFVAKCCREVTDRVQEIRAHTNANLLVVLDGATPPVKRSTTHQRRTQRATEEAQRDEPVDPSADATQLERRLQANRRAGAGNAHYGTVVDAVVAALRGHRVPFLVAPYEADGQLAFLQMKDHVDLVITEDSDLIAFGCFQPVLYRLTVNPEGTLTRGVLVRRDDLAASHFVDKSRLDFTDFSPAMLACVFAASGCDYCASLKGIGNANATKLVRAAFFSPASSSKASDDGADDESPLGRLIPLLLGASWDRSKFTDDDKRDFERSFLEAVLMFRHNLVYDPVTGRCRSMLSEPDPELVSYAPYKALCQDAERRAAIVGRTIPAPMVTHIAEGWICPKTMRPRRNAQVPARVQKDLEAYLAAARSNNNEQDDDDDDDEEEEVMETQQQQLATPFKGISVREARSQVRHPPSSSSSPSQQPAEKDQRTAFSTPSASSTNNQPKRRAETEASSSTSGKRRAAAEKSPPRTPDAAVDDDDEEEAGAAPKEGGGDGEMETQQEKLVDDDDDDEEEVMETQQEVTVVNACVTTTTTVFGGRVASDPSPQQRLETESASPPALPLADDGAPTDEMDENAQEDDDEEDRVDEMETQQEVIELSHEPPEGVETHASLKDPSSQPEVEAPAGAEAANPSPQAETVKQEAVEANPVQGEPAVAQPPPPIQRPGDEHIIDLCCSSDEDT